MTQMVTRCPKCATAFRITSTQLESAKGAVRCGSCLHIFKAQDHLVKSVATADSVTSTSVTKPSVTPAAISTTTSEKPKTDIAKSSPPNAEQLSFTPFSSELPTTSTPLTNTESIKDPITPQELVKPVIDKARVLEDEEDVLISDDMDEEAKSSAYEFDGFIDLNMKPKPTVSLFEREIRFETPPDDMENSEDESWAEDLLDEEDETPLQTTSNPSKKTILNSNDHEQLDPPVDRSDNESGNESSYQGPVFSIVGESVDQPTNEPAFSEEFLQATRTSEGASPVTPESSAYAAALFEEDNNQQEEQEKVSSKRPVKSSKIRAFDSSRAALLMNIMPAPVEFTARRMRRWYQEKLWSTLSVLMAILLFIQIAYFKFDHFSRVEPYRTAYLFLCPVFGCEVPTLVDTSQILATNLIVRNHPTIDNALMVDAILINNAPFEQPFPDLILAFSKLDETPVATRRFVPREYLAGELAGMQHIPERQPVHITLEISDPGPDAVNYSLSTH